METLNCHVNPADKAELALLRQSMDSIAPQGTVAVVGNFDGVHRGHQMLFTEAARAGLPVVAVTFEPHPREVFGREHHRLLTPEEREALLLQAGAARVVVLRFDTGLAAMPPQVFVGDVLLDALHMQRLVVGYDFVMGRNREGTGDVLAAMGKAQGFAVQQLPAMVDEETGEVISSTRIRNLLVEGNVSMAARLLGRSHRVTGTVAKGFQRGRGIGFPTANLERETPSPMLPARGVYATRAQLADGRVYGSVTNIGYNPTFGNELLTMETHLLHFDGDLYGQQLRVLFYERLRGERKFDGLEALKAQITADSQRAHTLLAQFPLENATSGADDAEDVA